MNEPFAYTIQSSAPDLLELSYAGYMGEHDHQHLSETDRFFKDAPGSVALCYAVPDMTGFHRSQVGMHGDLFLRHRDRLLGVGVIGARPVVRFGSITVGLIARITLRHFDDRADALAWLATLRQKKAAAAR